MSETNEPSHGRTRSVFALGPTVDSEGRSGERFVIRLDTMTVGEAAKLLGLSIASVQRLCQRYENDPKADPPAGISFAWPRPDATETDRFGAPLRGQRRVHTDAVIAWGKRMNLLVDDPAATLDT